MSKSELNNFLLKTVLFQTTKKIFPALMVYVLLSWILVVFFNDILTAPEIRWLGLSVLLSYGIVLAIIVSLQLKRGKKIDELKPLELEEKLKEFSSLTDSERKKFLNIFYLTTENPRGWSIKIRSLAAREKQFVLLLLVSFVLALLSPVFFPKGMHDLFLPWAKSAHLVSFEYELKPGNKKIERGDSLIISGTFANSPTPVFLKVVSENGNEESIASTDGKSFNYEKPNMQTSVSYRLENEWFRSENYSIKLVDRPFLQDFSIAIKPPHYTGKPAFIHTSANGNQLQIPEGSQISITGKFSKEIISGEVFGLKKNSVLSERDFYFEETVFRSAQLKFRVMDIDSLENRDTTSISISVANDLPPSLQVLQPNRGDPFVRRDYKIPVQFLAMDDYGISAAMIRYRIRSEFDLLEPKWNETQILQQEKPNPSLSVSLKWELPSKNLVAGDEIEMQIGVADGYPFIKGGHVVWSEIVMLKTPTLDELFSESEKATETVKEDLDRLAEKAKKLSEKIDKTAEDLKKKNGDISFSEQNQVKQIDRESKDLNKELEDSQKKMDEALKKLNENQTLPPETLQKYLELQQLLSETKSEKLQEMLKKVQEQMQNLDRKDVQKAVEDMKLNNENLTKQLDKTIKAIKRLQNEQKMEEMNQRANELASKEQEIQKEAQSEKPDFDKISSLQKMQTEQLKDFEKTVDQIHKQAGETDEKKFVQSKLEEMKDFLKKESMTQKSQKTEQSANQKDSKKTQENSKELSQKLQELKKKSDELQKEMKENQNMVILQLLRQLMLRSNKISELMAQNLPGKDAIRWGANYSESLLQSLKTISDSANYIGEREPQVGMLLNKDLSTATDFLNQAKEQYVDNQITPAEINRSNSRIQINSMIYRILSLMNQQQNQQGGKGQQGQQEKSFMDEMRELANRQQDLNQQVLNEQGNKDKDGPGKERLAQMAAQQQAISQQLQQMMERAQQKGENTGLSSDMTPIKEEMEKAAREINQQIDSKLIERQQKILSRMLESQRSTIQREFEEKRESFANKSLFKGSENEIQYDSSTLLQFYLLNSQLSTYPESYQKFIRGYIQNLPKK